MLRRIYVMSCASAAILFLAAAASAGPVVVYNNLTPNSSIGAASRPGSPGQFEIEAADDFVTTSPFLISGAHFIGLIVPNPGVTPTITAVDLEMYRVFPADSNTVRTPNVPTRNNSPSDVAFDTRSGGQLSFSTTLLSPSFTTLNSIQPGGIHPSPNQTTNGNGSVTGSELQFDVSLLSPFNLPADHYFFIPQVQVTGGTFYWLSASRPISGAGTTPFPGGFTDLQGWTRDDALDPDWLRDGTDIVGGTTPPTFNFAFSLDGTAVPEPGTLLLLGSGIAGLIAVRRRR